MPTISLCMIVKDEEDVLERCLLSVKNLVDEIIIVDTGSTDRTKEIASRFTHKIFEFEWVNDFSIARNFSFSKATKDYILWLDADDVIDEKNQEKFLQLKQELSSLVDSVMMPYHLMFDSEDMPIYSTMRNRLVKREKGFAWRGIVHEYLEVHGNIIHSNTSIHHKKLKAYTDRNLRIYRELVQKGEMLSTRDLYYYGNELCDHAFFEEALMVYEQFLQTKKGWIEDEISACINMAHCYANLNNNEEQIKSLFRAFLYDKPRAEVCCQLGQAYFDLQKWNQAIFWYNLATTLESAPQFRGLSYREEAWTWLPHVQLCVCYDKVGNIEKAMQHHRIAVEYNPNHPAVIHNEKYFSKLVEAGGV
ncbi:Glycosyltransferase involved in cell wall bisynthesis [Bacillus sp. 166amftsu]|nr:Glycosyltransferase involved in cell wall bisynthesis [Bacillus sp. 166amftsu]